MRKILCLFIALVLCMSMIVPAYAAENAFVPSIPDKDGPDIIVGEDDEGKPTIGEILDKDGNTIGYVYEDCLVVTSVAEVGSSEEIPEEAREELHSIYEQLKDGTMEVPYGKISDALDPDNMVIRELIDISWLCEEHKDLFEQDGATLKLTFDLGVGSNTNVYVMTYVNGVWSPVKSVVNNGDGTVTVIFEEICPVLFAVERDAEATPPQTGDNANLTLWIVLMTVSVAAIVAILVCRRKFAQKSR